MSSQAAGLTDLEWSVEQQEPAELVYVYAILPTGGLTRPPLLCMDNDRPVYLLEDGNLQADQRVRCGQIISSRPR